MRYKIAQLMIQEVVVDKDADDVVKTSEEGKEGEQKGIEDTPENRYNGPEGPSRKNDA